MRKSLDIAATALTALLLIGFAALALRGLIDPQSASARFGSAVSDPAGTLFYRVYLSRNLVIVAAGAIFLLTRQWTALSVLLTVTAALPLFDMRCAKGSIRCWRARAAPSLQRPASSSCRRGRSSIWAAGKPRTFSRIRELMRGRADSPCFGHFGERPSRAGVAALLAKAG